MNLSEKNVNGILKQLGLYIDLRFDHAGRLNPKFRGVEADLKWHEMDTIRHIIARKKPFAEFRISVADLMVSFDAEIRRGVFMPKGQLSILSEVVPVQDELVKTKGGGMSVYDLMTFYNAIDPALRPIMELLQTWVWWDLPDAVQMHMFEGSVERMLMVGRHDLNDQTLAYYKTVDYRGITPPSLSSRQTVLEFEFYRAEDTISAFEKRRSEDSKHMLIIAREAAQATSPEAGNLIMQLAQHMRAFEMLNAAADVDASLRDYYSKALQCPPDQVHKERALEFETRFISKARRDLRQALVADDGAGAPYDFKLRQLGEIKHTLERLRAEIKPAPRQTAATTGRESRDEEM